MNIIELKVTLDHVAPSVTRILQVPADIRLDRMHLTIQAAMGWTNSHRYMFKAGGATWGLAKERFSRVHSGGQTPITNSSCTGTVVVGGFFLPHNEFHESEQSMHHFMRPVLALIIALVFAVTGSVAHAMPDHLAPAHCSAHGGDGVGAAPGHHADPALADHEVDANATGKHCAAMTCPFVDAGPLGVTHAARLPVMADLPPAGEILAFALPEAFFRPPNA